MKLKKFLAILEDQKREEAPSRNEMIRSLEKEMRIELRFRCKDGKTLIGLCGNCDRVL